jgi:hypothetical protein
MALPAASIGALAWGNGSSTSAEFPNFGIHDITCDIALRSASLTDGDLLTWLNDWYVRNATDYGYSFDVDGKAPTRTDNVNAYTDDPDSYWQDWDNHTLYLHPRVGWDPPEGDVAVRVSQLYNLTRDHIYGWLMNGSVRYDADQHLAAYYAGLMSHYVMDVTQFGHTDWTRLDHSHPMDDPAGATYHSYYESRSWSDRALRSMHVDLMKRQLPQLQRVSDPARAVRDLATFVNGRHGPDVQFHDVDGSDVILGSTYVKMLELFVTDYDAHGTYNGARGYSEELWNLTRENLFVGMDNLTSLWTSAFLDARDAFRTDAADLVVEEITLDPPEGAYEGLVVEATAQVRNVGPIATGHFNVGFQVDNESVSEGRVELDAGEMTEVVFPWNATAGDHEIRFIADIYQQVPEGNETNNVGVEAYSVAEAHHGSTLVAYPATVMMRQDDSGSFTLRLTNIGNKADTYRVWLDTVPGAIDFSLTLNVNESITLASGAYREFTIDVTTLLENPVGPRYFRVVAEGGNSTATVTLALLIEERDTAPVIEVYYGFYGNVSVPMTFDASASWDRNGDDLEFAWFMDSALVGSGPELVWTFEEEGVYVLLLVVGDGRNNATETLEVSVQDALVPEQRILPVTVDIDAVQVRWEPWNSSKYFSETRFYAGTSPEVRDLVGPSRLVHTVDLPYVNKTVILLPRDLWGLEVFIVMETESIYGDVERSNVIQVQTEVLYDCIFGCPPPPIEGMWVGQVDDFETEVQLMWREWTPIGRGGHYLVTFRPWGEAGEDVNVTVQNLSQNVHFFQDLPRGLTASASIHYVVDSGSPFSVRYSTVVGTLPNLAPSIHVSPVVMAEEGREVSVFVKVEDADGNFSTVSVRWGDGSDAETLENVRGLLELDHTYGKVGEYALTVEATDLYGASSNATALVMVEAAGDGGPGGGWDPVIAIALILLVAVLGVIAGHLTGYYRIGREHEGRGKEPGVEPETEPEPEPTAEDIVSELEEDLGGGTDGDEYFDHEPSVSELEEMIPRDGEGRD